MFVSRYMLLGESLRCFQPSCEPIPSPVELPANNIPSPSHPSRILLIRPSALGDVCRTVPVLARLRRVYPHARIDWMVQTGFEDAVSAHPALTSVVPFDRAGLGHSLMRGNLGPLLAWRSQLREKRYDLVLDAQGLFRSGFFSWLTGSPSRIGPADAREFGWVFYTTRVSHTLGHDPAYTHTVDAMLALAHAAGAGPEHATSTSADGSPTAPAPNPNHAPNPTASLLAATPAEMQLYAPARDRDAVRTDPRFQGRFVVIAPGSRWPGKQWPADRFAQLIASLLAPPHDPHDNPHDAHLRVLLVGSPDEAQVCEMIAQKSHAILAQTTSPDVRPSEDRLLNLAGQTRIGQLMAIIEQSVLVVANDSAAVHIAVGFDRPLVALYGPTDITRVGPYNREHDVIQHITPRDRLDHKSAHSGRRLMERIAISEVVRACQARL